MHFTSTIVSARDFARINHPQIGPPVRLGGSEAHRSCSNHVTDFIATFENMGDVALNANGTDEAITAYSTALSLSPRTRSPLLIKWITAKLACGSWSGTLIAAAEVYTLQYIP